VRLELDVGNTRIKWRLMDHRAVFDQGTDLEAAMEGQPKWLPLIESVWVSSVSDDKNQWLQQLFGEVWYAQSQRVFKGLANSYADPVRMGVDRWLAMVAVWMKEPDGAHIVVDAGTAVTMDVISHVGQHMGGFICPGLQLMKSTLLGNTSKVLAQEQWLTSRALGQETQACVDQGILDMVVCWIERHHQQYPDAKIWLTGGDGERLASMVEAPVVYAPDLVLDGLSAYFLEQ